LLLDFINGLIFLIFPGHGGQVNDRDGDETDGKDEVLFPGDYADAGCITDDEIYAEFVSRISPGVHVVAVIDSCHSGTAMDLPYVCQAGEEVFRSNDKFKPAARGTALVAAAAAAAGAGVASSAGKKKKEKGKKGDKKTKKKKDGDDAAKKTKKTKNGTKKKKKNTEPEDDDVAASTADEEEFDGEDEVLKEVERPEKKKKKGLLGVFGRGRK
jgi:Caspase domain